MRYVRVGVVDDGYSLNPEEYLRILPEISADLPEGAKAFALDEEHYNFFGPRCVKDLKLDGIGITDREDSISIEISFEPNKFKHDQGLVVRYRNVVEFSIDVTSAPRMKHVWPETRRLGDFQLDELLPHDKGCSHEIRMTGGKLWIVAEDLLAEWRSVPPERL